MSELGRGLLASSATSRGLLVVLAGSKSSVNKRLEERNVWQGLRAHKVCWKDSTPGTYRPSGPLLNDGFSAIRVSAGICVRVHRTARALAAPKALLPVLTTDRGASVGRAPSQIRVRAPFRLLE